MALSLNDRIAKLKAKEDQARAKRSALEAKAKTAERKRETRRKIVVGAALLTAMEKDPALAASVRRVLGAAVTRPQDIEVLADLLAPQQAGRAPSETPSS